MNFLNLKASIDDLGAQLKDRKARREELVQEREELEQAPINREDFLAWLDGNLSQQKGKYLNKLQLQLENSVFCKSAFDMPVNSLHILDPNSNSQGRDVARSYSVVTLFKLQIMEQLKDILKDIEWPKEAKLSLDERGKKISILDKKIRKLDAEIEKLNSIANDAGLQFS